MGRALSTGCIGPGTTTPRSPDGTFYEVPGVSVLEYAGDGKFSFEEDIINMGHLYEVPKESGWVLGPNVKVPEKVVR